MPISKRENRPVAGKAQGNAAIDLAKLVLSVFVVAIHCSIDIGVLTPVFRVAVPFFFLCSGYFFFSKIARADSKSEERTVLRKFIQRNVILYLFWLVVQLPMVLRGWLGADGNLLLKILKFLQLLFFGNTFGASWYLSAMVIGCILFYLLSQRFSNTVLLAVGGVGYLACLLCSSYNGLVRDSVLVNFALILYNKVFLSVVNGIPAGFLWIAMGKYLAETPYKAEKWYGWLAAAGVMGLVLENMLVTSLDWQHFPDCYIMLFPICFGLFQFLRGRSWQWNGSVRLRHMSTVIYVSHGTVVALMWPLVENYLLRFGVVLLITVLLSWVIFGLEKYKPLSWLRYVH